MLAKIKKKTFTLNNKGNHYRDFTYIKDVIEILKKMILRNTITTMKFLISAQIIHRA